MVKIKPVLNQVELHPYFQQNELRIRMDKYNTKIEAWAPLGHALTKVFDEELIKKLGEKYKKLRHKLYLDGIFKEGILLFQKVRSLKE